MAKTTSAPAADAAPESKIDERFEQLVREKVAAGLPRKDSEEVAKRQIQEDDARAAAEKKK